MYEKLKNYIFLSTGVLEKKVFKVIFCVILRLKLYRNILNKQGRLNLLRDCHNFVTLVWNSSDTFKTTSFFIGWRILWSR